MYKAVNKNVIFQKPLEIVESIAPVFLQFCSDKNLLKPILGELIDIIMYNENSHVIAPSWLRTIIMHRFEENTEVEDDCHYADSHLFIVTASNRIVLNNALRSLLRNN